MKKSIATLLYITSFSLFGAPVPSYHGATNIARAVVNQTVTKQFVESLGIEVGGGGVDTNAVRDIIRDEITPATNRLNQTLSDALDGKLDRIVLDPLFEHNHSEYKQTLDGLDYTTYQTDGGETKVLDRAHIGNKMVYVTEDSNWFTSGFHASEDYRGFGISKSSSDFKNGNFSTFYGDGFIDCGENEITIPNATGTMALMSTTLSGYGITDGATKTELAAKRDLTDNVCRKTEFTEWICNPPRTEFGGVYSIRYDSPVKVYSLFDNEEVVEEIYSPTDDKLNLEFVGYCTATRSAVCSEGKKFVTSDVVDGKLSSAVSTNNPAFVSAVQNTPAPEPGQGEDPPWGTWGTVGAAIAGLVAGLKWLKDKVFDSAGNIQDQFATDLLGKQVANIKADTAALAAAYSETATYAVGDAVTHDGKLYKCSVAITTAEAWTAAHWTETTVATLWNNADTTSYGGQN